MTMSPQTAHGVIITGVIITGAATEIHRVASANLKGDAPLTQTGLKLAEPLIATGLLGVILFGIAAAGAPEIGAGFAITAAITSVLVNGGDLFKVLGTPSKAPPGATPQPGQQGRPASTNSNGAYAGAAVGTSMELISGVLI